jgi:two-component system CheB/CheR fusion protein
VPFKVSASDKFWFLVIFDEATEGTKPGVLRQVLGKTARQREMAALSRQLAASKESLQAIIEELEATNEELKSANEEVESSNEELQSTNEELTTLNEELSNRNLETMQVNSDLNNLLASVQLPIVMVDNGLAVRWVAPTARNVFNILQTDVGRPISDLKPNISIVNLERMLSDVIDTLEARERKVRDQQGVEYSLRVRPNRTADNKIDDAVITLVDIDGRKVQNASKTSSRTKQVSARQ